MLPLYDVRVCSIAASAAPVTASLQRSMLFLDKSSPEMSALQQLSNINLPAIPHTCTCVLDPDGIIPLVKCHCEHEKIYDLFTFLELWSIIGISLMCHADSIMQYVSNLKV